jgi:tRNA A37 threonylcarbamoyladenosine dehydratase
MAMMQCDTSEEDVRYRLHRRFDRLGRLYGDGAVERLMASKVAVFGVGGVGSFVAEALVRSAVGHVMLVDFDEVCVTNTNRQLQALKHTVGQKKALVLRDRLRDINPQAKVEAQTVFYNAERSDMLLMSPWSSSVTYDFVVDCIDNVTAKIHLLATCVQRQIPVVSSMGAAGKSDPTRIRLTDLAHTKVCRFAKDVRKLLRQKHGFPRKGPMGVVAVYSEEERTWPRTLTYDHGKGFRCVCPKTHDEHSCDNRHLIDGTAVFVTGAFGFAAASHVVNTLTQGLVQQAPQAQARHVVQSC